MILRQYTHPVIEFMHYTDFRVYHTFSDSADRKIQSYTFRRSVNSLDGSFSITLKAASVNGDEGNFINEINPLDIVAIYEDSKMTLDFLGVVSDIGFASTAAQGGGIIQISGKSVDSLFNRYKISNDKTAMASFNPEVANIESTTEFLTNDRDEKTVRPVKLNDIISTAWDKFNQAVRDNPKISSFRIGEIIEHFYTENFWDKDAGDIEFEYPISNHLFKDGESRFIDFLREILPEKVYELFGTIENNRPVLKVRQVPFTSGRWADLEEPAVISPDVLTDYCFRRSDSEVYTSFFSYLQGSIESQDFYRSISAASTGYTGYRTSGVNEEKAALYGYEPLFLAFTGFPSGFSSEEEKNRTNESVIEKFRELNETADEMYSRLDEMYSGNFTAVRCSGYDYPRIGERAKVTSMEFYITDENHSWTYGQPVTVNYGVSRGGTYNKGVFSRGEIESVLRRTISAQ